MRYAEINVDTRQTLKLDIHVLWYRQSWLKGCDSNFYV